MIQSYNTLVDALTQFSDNHLTLKRFQCSFFEQFDNFSTSGNSFPILYAIPSDVSFDDNIDEFSFRVYCVDILQKDRSNEQTILNETLLVLRDLTNWMRLDQNNNLNILNTPRAIPVNNFLTEFTTGWYVDITIETTPETSDCAIPFTANFIYSGVTVDCNQISPYLTCDTLAACASFISLDNRVTVLEANSAHTANYYTTGATLNGYTATFDRTDSLSAYTLDLTSLSGNPDTNTFVTGFTYDNINTFTINDSAGSAFTASINTISATTISGGTFYGDGSNLTGINSDNFYTTAATLNPSNVLSFNRTDALSAYTVDLSSLSDTTYWTGGTGTNSIIPKVGGNTASGINSFIGGGTSNTANGYYSASIGGTVNQANGNYSIVGGGYLNQSNYYGTVVFGGRNNVASGLHSSIIGGSFNTVNGNRSTIIGGTNIIASNDDTTYIPFLNISQLSATTSATTFNDIVVASDGSVMTNQLFYIGVNFETTGVTWNYIAPEAFQINSIDESVTGMTYTLLHNGTGYTYGNSIALYDDVSITGVTSTGFLKLNSELL